MLQTNAIITRLEGNEAMVEATGPIGCGFCSSATGCGGNKLSKMLCARPQRFRVHNGIGAQVGDEVQVSVADGALFRSAFFAYIFPLLFLFAGGALGTALAGTRNQDLYAAVGALAGLAAGFLLVRLLALRQQIQISALSKVIVPSNNYPGNRNI